MNKNIKLVLILGIIAGLSGLSLNIVNNITQPIIIKAQEELELEITTNFFPDVETTEKTEYEDVINYQTKVYDGDNNFLGYVYSITGSNGYGTITTLLGINTDNEIIGIDFSEFSQTPGFGDKLLNDEYLNQYNSLDVNSPQVDGVTGATFSSKLVADEVNKISTYHIENGGGNNE